MEKKIISITIASVVALVFLYFAIRPGVFNMIGYTISLLIFPANSPDHLKYENIIMYFFDIICGGVLFWIVYKLMRRQLK